MGSVQAYSGTLPTWSPLCVDALGPNMIKTRLAVDSFCVQLLFYWVSLSVALFRIVSEWRQIFQPNSRFWCVFKMRNDDPKFLHCFLASLSLSLSACPFRSAVPTGLLVHTRERTYTSHTRTRAALRFWFSNDGDEGAVNYTTNFIFVQFCTRTHLHKPHRASGFASQPHQTLVLLKILIIFDTQIHERTHPPPQFENKKEPTQKKGSKMNIRRRT